MAHIVDTLIEERAVKLRRHRLIWQAVRRFLYPALGYDQALTLVDEVQDMSGFDIFQHVSERLTMQVDVTGLEHLPSQGRAVLICNHPAGIADGIAVFEAIKAVRPDMTFFANRDAVRCAPRLAEIIIPVEWVEEKRNHAKAKEMAKNMIGAFRDERLIVIFPSGRLARPTPWGLVEREWLPSGVGLAQKYNCPMIPMHITGHNSALYYLLWFLNNELRDMTLFRELLNKADESYRLQIGVPILSQEDPSTLTPRLRDFVTRRLSRGDIRFPAPATPTRSPHLARP